VLAPAVFVGKLAFAFGEILAFFAGALGLEVFG
jgi:hypothetical protein